MGRSAQYYTETLGLTETARGSLGEIYASVGYEHHNVILMKAAHKSLLQFGFQLKPAIDLADFAKQLNAYGVRGAVKSDLQPGISKLIEVEVADGQSVQFYRDIEAPAPGFKNIGVAPLRLGHVAMASPHAAKLRKFYEEFLGFWYTDEFEGMAKFLTCNRDHHVINIVDNPESGVHHIAF